MSKPIREVEISTGDGKKARIQALFDSGSFHTIISAGKIPTDSLIIKLKTPKSFGTANKKGKLIATGTIYLEINVENHDIGISAFVAPNLAADMIVGAGAMQMWDISIKNDNGQTTLHIGRDMNDPDIQTVL